jgi:1-deoxy-D-xylulose-5-phosphate synthase
MAILENIHSPEDMRKLDEKSLRLLAGEMRKKIIGTVKRNGGHLASNLGVVELTIALHRVFESPKDAIVWDVGHQSYSHKLLTGRGELFSGLRKKDGISGFPKRSESEHDFFDTGHSSTSISAALGLLEARLRRGEGGNVVAVIGDGALTAGMAFEGLSNAGQLGKPLIIVLNDNKMSISKNVGSISLYLSRLSANVRYQTMRSWIDSFVRAIPVFGPRIMSLIVRGKRAVKAVFFKENLFVDFGFEYVGPIDGHNIAALTRIFEQVKKIGRPVVVHVVTTKGKGYEKAEDDPEHFHGIAPFCLDEKDPRSSFTEVFAGSMLDAACESSDVVGITAAMSQGTGLEVMRQKFPSKVYDVGIAEQHAVTFAAGLATGGLKPVVALYSTFAQRAVDQIFHDVALPNLHVILALDRAGAVGDDGETHQGLYDIALFRNFPNLTILAPSTSRELSSFLKAALEMNGPCIIRYPKARVPCIDEPTQELEMGRGVYVRRHPGSRVLVCALGAMVASAIEASESLFNEGESVDVYSLRFVRPLDEEYLVAICSSYDAILTIEDGVKSGGVGEEIVNVILKHGLKSSVRILGFDSMPLPQASREELLCSAGLDVGGIRNSLDSCFQELPAATGTQVLKFGSSLRGTIDEAAAVDVGVRPAASGTGK